MFLFSFNFVPDPCPRGDVLLVYYEYKSRGKTPACCYFSCFDLSTKTNRCCVLYLFGGVTLPLARVYSTWLPTARYCPDTGACWPVRVTTFCIVFSPIKQITEKSDLRPKAVLFNSRERLRFYPLRRFYIDFPNLKDINRYQIGFSSVLIICLSFKTNLVLKKASISCFSSENPVLRTWITYSLILCSGDFSFMIG